LKSKKLQEYDELCSQITTRLSAAPLIKIQLKSRYGIYNKGVSQTYCEPLKMTVVVIVILFFFLLLYILIFCLFFYNNNNSTQMHFL